VLFITADQWRGDCLSALSHPVVATPHLDALAREGTLFTHHFANAVPCGPSRACLHTGLYLHNHRSGTNGTPLDRRFTNWALEARRYGYDPALFGYTHTAQDPRYLPADDPRLGTDEGILPGITPVVDMGTHCGPWRDWLGTRGYTLPDDHGATYGLRAETAPAPDIPRPSLFDPAHTDTRFLTDRAIEHIERVVQDDDNPGFCVHLSLRAPHPPWVAAAPYNTRYHPRALPAAVRAESAERESALHPWLAFHLSDRHNRAHDDDRRHRLLQASYYGLMSEVDDNLGRLLARLRALGVWDQTLIVFTSDHGEQMGDHWMYGKAGFFDQSYRVPFIVRNPTGTAGYRVDQFTEHVDLMPTLLDWIGIDVPRQCDGRSLLPFTCGTVPPNWRDAAHWELDFREPSAEAVLGLRMEQCLLNVIRDTNGKYVHFAALEPLLFDLVRDPFELVDVATAPGYERMRADYAHRLLSWRMQHSDKTLSHIRVTRDGIENRARA
jgi:arylsulfatase A-like enzyme